MRSRARGRGSPAVLAWAVAVAAVLLALSAGAGAAPRHADLQQYHPPDLSTSFLGLDDPMPLGHLGEQLGLTFSSAHDPLVLRDGAGVLVPGGHLVANQLWMEATGALGLFRRFEVGAAVPFALYQGGDRGGPADLAAAYRGQRGAGLGDLRFGLKALLLERFFGRASGGTVMPPFAVRLSLLVDYTVPSATSAFTGDANMTGTPRFVLGFYAGRLELVAEVGALLRERERVLNLELTQEITWGVGLRAVLWRGLDTALEGRGWVGVAPFPGHHIGASDTSAEVDVSFGYRLPIGLRPFVGGGVGLGSAYGTPDGRFIFGAHYEIPEQHKELPWELRDDDQDGVRNELDACVHAPGPAANHGCPDTDKDHDGVTDRFDQCPDKPGPAANHGCPDVDTDGDGVVDRLDKCPAEPGPAVMAGCPPKDRDHDGVPDAFDQCPDKPGVPENGGCPDVDSDGDGIVDRLDKCPFDVEIYNGVEDEDGCPDAGPALVGLAAGQVALFEPLVFEKEGAGEKLSARSLLILDAAGALLRNHAELQRVRVDGHTDNRGDPVDNLDRSLRRAQLVRKILVERERIDPRRVTAQGFGGDRPITDNATAQGRARNRRIEITILDAPAAR